MYKTASFVTGPNAFEILMKNARSLRQLTLPSLIENPKNKKQKLRNDFISFLSKKNIKWHADEVASSGEAFIKAVVDALWEIDGHHDVFKARSFSIPPAFHPFTGYNLPELSKHRKRSRQNMSSTSLRLCSNALFACLQGVYWDRQCWKDLKQNFEGLATSLLTMQATWKGSVRS